MITVERAYGDWDYGVKNLHNEWICGDAIQAKGNTMTSVVQICLDAINEDIAEMESLLYDYSKILNMLRPYRELKCPCCGSKKIFKFRLDSDWASGAGDYSAVNENEHYTEEELNYDSFDRPDVEVYHCGECNHFFE